MNGVEILTSNEVAVAYEKFSWSNFWIAIAVFAFFAMLAGWLVGLDSGNVAAGVIAFLVVLIIGGTFFGPIVGYSGGGEPIKYETQYKVTIDDSVSMTEFLDKYEILDQEGQIYTVRERE